MVLRTPHRAGIRAPEFEGAEQDTGTIVGELGSGEHQQPTGIPSARPTGQEARAFPAVRALARKLNVALEFIDGARRRRWQLDVKAHPL
jgi:2-oxoisovalerate dehydrogenase E2 component (dihydrolipoyl transacylase)